MNVKNIKISSHVNGKTISNKYRDQIMNDLKNNMSSYEISQYFELKFESIFSCEFIVLATEIPENEVIGLWALSFLNFPEISFLNSFTTLLAERYHKSNLLRRMLKELINTILKEKGKLPSLIALKTYNAQTYNAIRVLSLIEGVSIYPDIQKAVQTKAMTSKAKMIAKVLCPSFEFNPLTGVIINGGVGVSENFYPVFPACSKEKINNYFLENLTPADRLLCLLAFESKSHKKIIKLFSRS